MKHNKTKLGGVILEVTGRCNLNCLYCYNIHKMPGGPAEPQSTYKKARKVLSHLFSIADVDRVTMSGGEPFRSERFSELALYCRMKGKKVVVITNGTAATREQYKLLSEIDITLYELPLHSDRPKEHDEMTTVKGSWDKVRQSIDTILELGGTVVPMIVITKINASRVVQTLMLFKKLGLKRVMLNRFNVGGAGISNFDKLVLSNEELFNVFKNAGMVAEKTGHVLSSNVCTPACVLNNKDHPRIGFAYCAPDITRRPLTLDVDGNLRFCNHSPVFMGNIYEQPLEEILYSDYTRSWQDLKPDYCKNCDLWEKCYGGCRAACEQLGRGLDEVDPMLSQHLSADNSSVLPK